MLNIQHEDSQPNVGKEQDEAAREQMMDKIMVGTKGKDGKLYQLAKDALTKEIQKNCKQHVQEDKILVMQIKWPNYGADAEESDYLQGVFGFEAEQAAGELSRCRQTGTLGQLDKLFVYSRNTNEIKEEVDNHLTLVKQQIASLHLARAEPKPVVYQVTIDAEQISKKRELVDGQPVPKQQRSGPGKLIELAKKIMEAQTVQDVSKTDFDALAKKVDDGHKAFKTELGEIKDKVKQGQANISAMLQQLLQRG